MKKTGMLFVCILAAAACGGSKKSAQAPMPDETAANPDTTVVEPAPVPTTEVEPTPAPPPEPAPPPPPPPVVATAELKAVKDDASLGTISFEKGEDGKITISGQFTGLKKGPHAIYIHENGDCAGKAKKVGGHLNPTKAKHGPAAASERHAGDFGDLTADATGAATFSMVTDSVTLEADRPDSVVNRAVVIHVSKDDKKGVAGAAFACGVIALKAE